MYEEMESANLDSLDSASRFKWVPFRNARLKATSSFPSVDQTKNKSTKSLRFERGFGMLVVKELTPMKLVEWRKVLPMAGFFFEMQKQHVTMVLDSNSGV